MAPAIGTTIATSINRLRRLSGTGGVPAAGTPPSAIPSPHDTSVPAHGASGTAGGAATHGRGRSSIAPPHFFQKEGSQHATALCVGDSLLLYSDKHNVMLSCDGFHTSV